MTLEKKQVTVVGLGKSGEAAAAFLAGQGACVTVVDDILKQPPATLTGIKSDFPIAFHLGDWATHDLLSSELVVISPGVPLSRLPMEALSRAGIPVIGEMELASRFLTAPIIAITGTNGKSTTATLVAEILKESHFRVFLGGNIGTPLCLAAMQSFDYIVAEVSSFQLETAPTFRPKVAALLNVTEDHLNRHGSMEHYRALKERIFHNQTRVDYAVINAQDPPSGQPPLKAVPIVFVSPGSATKSLSSRGVTLLGDTIVSNVMGSASPIIRWSTILTNGPHHLENVMAAIAISQLVGASPDAIRRTLTRFVGLPHRMEKVREIGGVSYINDSKGTNVGAVKRALEGMTRPVVLIAGGRDKGSDFTPLRDLLAKKVKRLIVMGEAADSMIRCFAGHPAITRVQEMKEAVVTAAAVPGSDHVVLLSPGCASFDMFKNFEHRGDCFKQAVLELRS